MQLCAVNFIALQRYSTCFGCFPHQSSGVHPLYLQPPVQVPEAVDTVNVRLMMGVESTRNM